MITLHWITIVDKISEIGRGKIYGVTEKALGKEEW